jgi:Fur family zinc uptake transcriptional regulator
MEESSRQVKPLASERAVAAVRLAKRICDERHLKLTGLRSATLEEIAQSGPISAYQLMRRLSSRLDRRVDPPTVYRSLDFLMNAGLIARLESRSAFVLRHHPDQAHPSVLMLCDHCDSTVELEDPKLVKLIEADAAALGFRLGGPIIECSGTCQRCSEQSSEAAR